MTNVAMYTEQTVLTAGIQAVVSGLDDLTIMAFTDLDGLVKNVRTLRPSVVLVDLTDAVTFTTLSKLITAGGGAPVILWVDVPSMDVVSQALALGVRGILRKSLPVELQLKCLRSVAGGDLWVEKGITAQLLTSRRISLTRRERQVMSLLAQGAKNKEIAYGLNLTEGTVKVYLSRIFHKVGVRDRFELALFAIQNLGENGLREPEVSTITSAGDSPAESIPECFFPVAVSKASLDSIAMAPKISFFPA
jgi:two-component system nitrate/nitrite response regulator NarL